LEHYTYPPLARKKIRIAQEMPQTAYIFGATGYGKTELVKQFIGKRRHIYLSCADGLWDSEVLPKASAKWYNPSIVVIDDLHRLQNEEKRQEVIALARRSDVWLVLISRSPVPAWLMPCYVEQGFMLIQEADLCLGKSEVSVYLKSCGITLEDDDLEQICQIGQGNAYAVRQMALLIQAGVTPGPALKTALLDAMSAYAEQYILNQWDSELVEFLMQVSVVDEFTLKMAEIISGNSHAVALLEQAMEIGNFLAYKNGVYHFRPVLQKALINRCAKLWGTDRLRDLSYNAGLYYEMHDQIVPAPLHPHGGGHPVGHCQAPHGHGLEGGAFDRPAGGQRLPIPAADQRGGRGHPGTAAAGQSRGAGGQGH
jgi:LuxR family maltose regulon positive regulatory protein